MLNMLNCSNPTLCEGTESLVPMVAVGLVLWAIVIAMYVEFEVRRKR